MTHPVLQVASSIKDKNLTREELYALNGQGWDIAVEKYKGKGRWAYWREHRPLTEKEMDKLFHVLEQAGVEV